MLPLPLLDLLLHRTSIPFNRAAFQFRRPKNARYVQSLLARLKTNVNAPSDSTNWSQSIPSVESQLSFDHHLKVVSEFESRVSTAKDSDLTKSNEEYQDYQVEDTELQNIYRDLFSSSDVAVNVKDDGLETDVDRNAFLRLLETLEERFKDVHAFSIDSNSLSSQLRNRSFEQPSVSDDNEPHVLLDLETATSSISASVRSLVNTLETCLQALDPTWLVGDETPTLSLGLLSKPDWGTLIKGALAEDDTAVAERILSLMKLAGEQSIEEQYDLVLNWYAQHGLVEEADVFCSRLSVETIRDRQRDLLVKARLKANRLDEACQLLHFYESNATPAPIRSYTRVIRDMLFRSGPGSEQSKAQAWDMFSHMRYAAHPIPDEFLYTTMIRSLAESQDPEAERALNLFTELTIDNKMSPSVYCYNAVILVCARSKKYKMEAFRLAREMLNSPAVSLRPDKHTFLALLEAAKRLGDLNRTRWILTQLIKETRRSLRSGMKINYVDEKIMEHVLHAYASYMPPFHRNMAPEQNKEQDKPVREETTDDSEALQTFEGPSRPHAPQTHQEVIREAGMLWNRIFDDVEFAETGSIDDTVFGNVAIDTRLVNAYITVHFRHSPPDAAFAAFKTAYEESGVPKDARSYLTAFNAYTLGKRCTRREMRSALEHARALWPEWQALENSAYAQVSTQSIDANTVVNARMVEKAWTSMFRLLAHNDCLDEAMNLVREFVKRYPPSLIRIPSPSDPSRSPKITLYAERPLVRLIEPTSIPEDRIPPFLLFRDLELLHSRSVSAKRRDYVDYIKWVASAYAGALRQRQRLTYGAADNKPTFKMRDATAV